jgi:hypothetical protein
MENPIMRFILSLLVFLLFVIGTGFAAADEPSELPLTGILNADFANHLGTVTTLNDDGEEGVFVLNENGEAVISMLREDVITASNERLGGFLSAYDESGQSLFVLPDGSYQLQFSTSNGSINLNYLNPSSSISTADSLSLEEDALLVASMNGEYQFYLMTTGELSVLMGPDEDGILYRVTFTGIPALNVKQDISAN